MHVTVTKQDGMLSTLTAASIEWTDLVKPYELNRVYKVDSDYGYLNNKLMVGSDINTYTYQANYYNTVSSTWETASPFDKTFDDLEGLNIVIKDGSTIYICKDEHLPLIPDYLTTTTISYRINEKVNANNINEFYHFKPEPGVAPSPIVCLIGASVGGNNFKAASVGVKDGIGKVTLVFIPFDPSKNWTLENGSRSISQSLSINDQGYIDSSVESRLSTLEYKVQLIEQKMKEYDKVIGNLPAITTALQENVTKFYVSR